LTIGYLVAFPALSNIASLIFSVVDNWTGLFKAKFIEKAVFLTKSQKAALYKEMKRQAEAHKVQIDSLNETLNAMNSLLVSGDMVPANDGVMVNNDATSNTDENIITGDNASGDKSEKVNSKEETVSESNAAPSRSKATKDTSRPVENTIAAMIDKLYESSPLLSRLTGMSVGILDSAGNRDRISQIGAELGLPSYTHSVFSVYLIVATGILTDIMNSSVNELVTVDLLMKNFTARTGGVNITYGDINDILRPLQFRGLVGTRGQGVEITERGARAIRWMPKG